MRKTDHHRRGFTLIEMVAVIGIILVIIGALLPALVGAWRNARRTRSAHDLQVISGALEEYHKDFGDYPRIDYVNDVALQSTQNPGACILCWALVAPGSAAQDGADGPGFRLRGTTGKVHDSYLNIEQFKYSALPASGEPFATILDPNSHPYLYFPAYRGTTPAANYVANWTTFTNTPTEPYFNFYDNLAAFSPDNAGVGIQRMQIMVGDKNYDGKITGSEVAKWTGPYLLWGAGPDEFYGPIDPTDSGQVTKCDDVTNVP